MALDKNNILALGNSTDGLEQLLDIQKQILTVLEGTLVQTQLINEYLKAITNLELTKEDICPQ